MKIENILAFDIELFPNYFLLSIKDLKSEKIISYELKDANKSINSNQRNEILDLISKNILIGYNCNNYDIPILIQYLHKKSVLNLKKLSDYIISNSIYKL